MKKKDPIYDLKDEEILVNVPSAYDGLFKILESFLLTFVLYINN